MAESEEELKSLLMKVKEESEEVCLKLNIQKSKIMASGPITSGEIDGETVETVADFIWGGGCSKIIADGDCSHEIKRHVLLGRKAMTNLNSILKSRDTILPTKVCRRRQWHPTPVLLPGQSHGRRSLAGYSPRGHRELNTTERLHFLGVCSLAARAVEL